MQELIAAVEMGSSAGYCKGSGLVDVHANKTVVLQSAQKL